MAGLDTEAFRKILMLEESRGYGDDAVVGGLDRFLQRWADDLSAVWGEKPVDESYASLPKTERKVWVEGWLGRLNGGTAEPKAPKKPQPAMKKAKTEPAAPPPPKAAVGLGLDSPASRLRGVDVKLSAKLKRIGVSTIKDLLFLMPRRA